MSNHIIRDILIKELGIESYPEEIQDEVVVKLGEVILKDLTIKIFEKLPLQKKEEFERISAMGDDERIQEFLEHNIPDMNALIEEEVKNTLKTYTEKEKSAEQKKL